MSTRDQFQKVFNEYSKLKSQVESEKRKLELQAQELEKREAHNESERKRLFEEFRKVSVPLGLYHSIRFIIFFISLYLNSKN